MKETPSELLENLVFRTLSQNAKPDNDLGILMIEETKIDETSIAWDAYKIHHKDMIHYNEDYFINRCADCGKYTGTIS